MPDDPRPESELEIAHVLFADIVGYSKLPIERQSEFLRQLNQIVRNTEQFRAAETAGKLVPLPTGDGMALAFFTSPEAPVRCATAIAQALQAHPELKLRMGIDSGPVDKVRDVNDRSNVAGGGINMAQRVMDCGDAGHILLSNRVAGDLGQYSKWQSRFHDLGEVEVKHGVKIGIVNFVESDVGNPAVPEKIRRLRRVQAVTARRRTFVWSLGAIAAGAALVAAFWLQSRRAVSPAAASVPEKSIAVLPLENLSEDKADAFFADGIQDDVLTSLAKISDLKVISRTSVMQYRGANRNLRDIGHSLGVANILEGSVRRVGNRVLVNVQLIDALHDRHLWAERYDRTLADSIGLQGELAAEIARALRARLDPEEKTRLATQPTTNPEAYVLYLRARDKQRTAASRVDGIAMDELYAQAIALDPAFAVALARRSILNSRMWHVGRLADRKIKAHALATEALRLAPDLGEAHLALGLWLYYAANDFDAALKELSIAAKTMSNDAELHDYVGLIYNRQGRWREALASFKRAQEVDPRNVHPSGADTLAIVRDWPAAAFECRRLLEIDPQNAFVKMTLAGILAMGEGDLNAAQAILQTIGGPLRDNAGNPTANDTLPRWDLLMLQRDFAGAQKLLDAFPAEEFPPPFVGYKTFDSACTALARGDTAAAHTLFEKVVPLWEAAARDNPEDARFHAPLGILYAYLGRKEEALRESRRAVELCPLSKDALTGPGYLHNLALIYARAGEAEEAVTLLEHLLTIPAWMSLTELRLSWEWDPLRENPRFQKLVAGPEPKTVY